MQIDSLEVAAGPILFYDPGFMNVIEDHMSLLRADTNTSVATIDAYKTLVYEGDFYGMLSDMGIPRHYHWTILRLNNLTTPTDFGPGRESVLLPDRKRLDRMRSAYATQNKIAS
jgi:hypothetical protein